ncbi:MAG: zinc-ribbon domain-containing protein [Paracoccaceae bacterium]
MRLICSNCDAQYDVDDSVIPDAGRDVQCSNCGHAWFQPGPYREGEPEAGEEAPEAEPAPEAGDSFAEAPQADRAGAGEAEPEREPEPERESAAPRRALDEDMLNVLREEAALETRARRDEGAADLEIQPDLGLAETAAPVRPAPAGPATFEEAVGAAAADPIVEARGRHRRGLLPDIEEINSTLTAAQGRAALTDEAPGAEQATQRRGGFRLGFSLSLIAAGLLLALYVLAPSLARQAPALAPALTAYVSTVNQARLGIDTILRRFTDAMRGGGAGG